MPFLCGQSWGSVAESTRRSGRGLAQPIEISLGADLLCPPHSGALHSATASGVEGVRQSLLGEGYEPNVANRVANSVRTSSQKIYNSKWDRFPRLAQSNDVNPCQTSVWEGGFLIYQGV